MREPILNETDAPPRRRSLTLATPKKNFVRISDFARARFFLLKGKQNFSLVSCSGRAGWRDWPLFDFARTARHSSPQPPFAVFLRGRTGFLASLLFLSVVFIKLFVNQWTIKIFSRTPHVVWVKIACSA